MTHRSSRARTVLAVLAAVLPDVLSLGVGVLSLPATSIDPIVLVAALVLVASLTAVVVVLRLGDHE